MHRSLIAALASALLAAPAGLATHTVSYERDVLGPTAVHVAAVGDAGFAYCNDTVGQLVLTVVGCGWAGLSATIDVSALNHGGGADPAEGQVFASGTCSSRPDGPLVDPYTAGSFSFLCGLDRDDDSLVTNVDVGGSTDPDGFDDDFAWTNAAGGGDTTTVAFCGRADGGSGASTYGASWDTLHVFIEENAPSASLSAGAYSVGVELTASASGCGTISGHTHDAWEGTPAGSAHSCGLSAPFTGCLEGLGILG